MLCPPAGAKYPFFKAPAHGLKSLDIVLESKFIGVNWLFALTYTN